MGIFDRKRPLKLDHLLNGKIDLERKGSLGERMEFAWGAYVGNHAEKYKTAAFDFLVKSFKIPQASKELDFGQNRMNKP